ncbi:actin cytoskeleton-regulatory complex protein PAN1-like [Camellia sinensis]|uniref:actin cytoskeleton-regulatory complex protein PAN1-like n=1 Tax=Camellia sinensis TaxID=4442 RepID=UPI001035B966|nr:actin cytoskeleton-regulatory complex protein PAN1-like [Camellia sinensis]
MPPPKPKRTKRAQPKAKVTQVESEDTLPISKLVESKKASSAPAKRSAETPPSESTQSKKPRSASATTSGSKKPDVPRAPKITLEDRPIMSNESANDINVGVALSTALLLPGDLERNAEYSEYENYALMFQHSVQENKTPESKMKELEDQAEAATKAQTLAEEKAESAEAIKMVAEAEKREAEDKKAQAEKELQDALSTKDAKIKAADEKAYAQGIADVTEEYKLQVRQVCNRGFSLGWMALAKKLNLPENSPLRQADAIPLPFPPPSPLSQAEDESESESEDEDKDDNEALDEEVIKETTPEQASSDVPQIGKSVDETLAEIDAELAMEKAAEVALQESAEVQTKVALEAEEPQL